MAVEQETISLIIFGFIFVIVLISIPIFVVWYKSKNRGVLWFLPQIIMLSICLSLFLRLIHNQNTVPAVMLSEENSLTIGLMGISWALSMVFMTVGVLTAIKNKTG